ncbi:hypothetical protein [Caldifermentibacillus hisashii]|uniref:hypothetical protein n=1 Tax=Caldifermentibacillus hisashii TaxID=996558 RepID=UPI0022B940FC|nr:hypothetical protein [Caldifermentibacillus hisashii]
MKTTYRNARKEKFTPISNSLLWDKEASLQAKGLLSIFLSNSDDWELNMKEIITRSKNGRDAHYKIVNELIELGYFARVQVVDPTKRQFEEMIYIFSDIKQEVEDEIENVKKWASDNCKHLIIEYKTKKEKDKKMKDEPVPENQDAANQDNNNTKGNNTNSNNHNIDYIDDDKRTSQQVGKDSAAHNEESINLIISNFRQATKGELTERSFKAVVRKVVDKYNQGKINSFRDYLATALTRKMEELELRKEQAKAKEELSKDKQRRLQQKANRLQKTEISHDVVFYNWLEE